MRQLLIRRSKALERSRHLSWTFWDRMKHWGAGTFWLALGLALTGLFYSGFWRGEGLIGGDLYTYFFPQKVYYAERLAAGEFPLWNNEAGHGYPLVAESQTGAFYPPNYLAYQLWDVNTAYNIVQILHYALAFGFCAALGRTLGFSVPASALAGLVFVYGWFPARLSLEWAILTGAWMPAAIWCVEKLITTGRWRYAGGLAVVLALQMLAGHFHLAFITQVLVVCYAFGRVLIITPQPKPSEPTREVSAWTGWKRCGLVLIAAGLGFGLAAVQLLPTWELKTLSQRSAVGTYYDPAYGRIPVWYLTQIIAPFVWYGTGADLNAGQPPGSPATNAVEAHLYFGLVPVLLLLYGMGTGVFWRDGRWRLWGLLGILALIYATGVLLPMTKFLPGFHYFRGVGRWGIVTTLAAAVLSGAALEALLSRRRSRLIAYGLAAVLLGLTATDLRIVSGLVGDGIFVENPPITRREDSPVGQLLKEYPQPVRLFCRGANLPTLLGVSSTPAYLGIGPDEYFDPKTTMPEPLPFDQPPTPAQVDWLQRAGVTHVLSFSPVDRSAWPVEEVWAGYDPFLCRSWARGPNEPLSLYRLQGSRGRAAWQDPKPHQTAPQVRRLTANRVVVHAASDRAGTLILTSLMYPGWQVAVDDKPAEPLTLEGMYRGVKLPPGKHSITWTYRPSSIRTGIWISGLTAFILMGMTMFRWRRTRLPTGSD